MQISLEGLANFAKNIEPTMQKIKDAVDQGQGKAAKLNYHEQYSVLQFFNEVCDYLYKQS